MYRRSYIALIVAFGLVSGLQAENALQALFTQQSQILRDSSEDFYDKIPARRKTIEADLGSGKHEPWESVFYDGSPTLGFVRGWIISSKKGYVSTTRRVDMGSVKVEGDRIALVSEAPANAWGIMPVEYVLVPWDKQVFLVEPVRLLAFCNDVNSGQLRHCTPSGNYLLRAKDFDKERPSGLPRVPTEYKESLLQSPISGNVVKTGDGKQDVAVRGEKRLMSGTSVTLSVGRKDGVRTGMRFYAEQDLARSNFFVISVADGQCEVLQCGEGPKARVNVGLRLTTTDHFYDRQRPRNSRN
jgi:hypothetical protein